MDRSGEITLLKHQRVKNAQGVWIDQGVIRRKIFCRVDSVSRAEFFACGQNGIRPEYKFTVFFADYSNEEDVEYNGVVYAIYRIYHARNDDLELYARLKVGLSNG